MQIKQKQYLISYNWRDWSSTYDDSTRSIAVSTFTINCRMFLAQTIIFVNDCQTDSFIAGFEILRLNIVFRLRLWHFYWFQLLNHFLAWVYQHRPDCRIYTIWAGNRLSALNTGCGHWFLVELLRFACLKTLIGWCAPHF